MSNSTAYSGQCSLIDPLTWDPSLTNQAAKTSSAFAVSVQILMIPFVILINSVTILIVVKYEAMQERRFVELALLSITDFLSGLIAQPLFVASQLYHALMNEVDCNLDSAVQYSTSLFTVISFYQLTFLTYERYVAITDALHYPYRITIRRLLYVAVAIWMIHVIVMVLYGTIMPPKATIAIIIFRVLLLFCIIYWYIKIFTEVRKQKRNVHAQTLGSANHVSNWRSYLTNHKSAINAVCLVSVFGLCSVPIFVSTCFVFSMGPNVRGPLYFALMPWVNICVHSSSLFNPLLYGVRMSEYRRYFYQLIGSQPRNNRRTTPQRQEIAALPQPSQANAE